MATKDVALTHCALDSLHADDYWSAFVVGQVYIDGKAYNNRTVLRGDLNEINGWTLTDAVLRGTVSSVSGNPFAATLRRVTEEFDTDEATYNDRLSGTAWATAGADTPNSATDTDKIQFTSPAATGEQDIVTGLLTLVETARAGDNIFRCHIRSDNENPGVTTRFSATGAIIRVTGTPPPLRRPFAQVV